MLDGGGGERRGSRLVLAGFVQGQADSQRPACTGHGGIERDDGHVVIEGEAEHRRRRLHPRQMQFEPRKALARRIAQRFDQFERAAGLVVITGLEQAFGIFGARARIVDHSAADAELARPASAPPPPAGRAGDGAPPRAGLGALKNRLQVTISNLAATGENLSAAQSRIQDVDVASETAALTRNQILSQAGIACAPEAACATVEEAVVAASRFGYPVVLKILSPDILHKSEIGGVLLAVADEAAVRAGFALLLERAGAAAPAARIEGVLVAKQLKGGVECILGIHRDPVFGPIAMFGLGGIMVEILKDVSFRIVPPEPRDAREMIQEIKGYPVLQGYRGQAPVDIAGLEEMLLKVSAFIEKHPEVRELDLNPVLAYSDGAVAVDARIMLGETE